jgi:hypothetical protein
VHSHNCLGTSKFETIATFCNTDMSSSSQGKKSSGLRSFRARIPNIFNRSPSSHTSQHPQQSTSEYTAIGGLPTTPTGSLTPGQRIKQRGGTVYRGLIEIVQALSDCSDIFLPLKTACNVILAIHKTVDVRRIRAHIVCEINLHISFWLVEGVDE